MKQQISPNGDCDCDDETATERPSTKNCLSKDRKKRRGVIEKCRRDRINASLLELRRLVPSAFEKQGTAKLEKAEILQLTVDHLKLLKHQEGLVHCDPQTLARDYRSLGFKECAVEVGRYLVTEGGMDVHHSFRIQILNHLHSLATHRPRITMNPSSLSPVVQICAPPPNPATGSLFYRTENSTVTSMCTHSSGTGTGLPQSPEVATSSVRPSFGAGVTQTWITPPPASSAVNNSQCCAVTSAGGRNSRTQPFEIMTMSQSASSVGSVASMDSNVSGGRLEQVLSGVHSCFRNSATAARSHDAVSGLPGSSTQPIYNQSPQEFHTLSTSRHHRHPTSFLPATPTICAISHPSRTIYDLSAPARGYNTDIEQTSVCAKTYRPWMANFEIA